VAVPETTRLMTVGYDARLVFAMCGRAPRSQVSGATTGAVSDIEQSTKIARAMVTESA
jgi:cell division protease FtsH